MADLDSFFAKKDKRKKKNVKVTVTTELVESVVKSGSVAAAPPETLGGEMAPAAGDVEDSALKSDASVTEKAGENGDGHGVGRETVEEVVKPSEDGWIEVEESKTAVVHTGGRTIVELGRGHESSTEKAVSKGDAQEEVFQGWKVREATDATRDEKFPSLAEAAKMPKVIPQTASEEKPKAISGRRQIGGALKALLQDASAGNNAATSRPSDPGEK